MTPPFVLFKSETIRLDALGKFWYGEQQVEHAGVEHMLRTRLTRLPSGDYGYIMGPHTVTIIVDDTPFHILSIYEHDQQLMLAVSDETHEALETSSLTYENDVPYCNLGRGDRARFLPGAALSLGHFLEVDEAGQLLLVFGEERHPILGVDLEDKD